jgi:hypothetical protein
MVVACCPLGPLVVAFEAALIDSVSDAVEGAEPGDVLDLVQRFGVSLENGSGRRRRIDVRHGKRALALLVGPEVLVRELSAPPRPLPAFVADFAQQACIQALIEWRKGYAFVLDLEALSSTVSMNSMERGLE